LTAPLLAPGGIDTPRTHRIVYASIADAAAERTLLGVCMRDPARLDDRTLSRALFAIPPHGAAFAALRTAHTHGLLAGDLSTAAEALSGLLPPSVVAEAFVRAEDILPVPLKKHLTVLAHRRQSHALADALVHVAETPGALAEDRETLATLAGQVAALGVNGAQPFTVMEGIQMESVHWLWHRRIPLGKLTLLDGDPGLGKTALALDLAARISTGAPLESDGRIGSPAGVVILNAEDGLADTLRPRLDAAGADCTRIVAFDLDHIPMLPTGLPVLRDAIRAVEAQLLIIDPIMAVLSASCDAYRDQDVRLILRPLAALAQDTGVAVLLVRHLTKSPGPKALYRGGGSIAFSAAARSVLLVAPDPNDPTDRILAPVKANLCPPATPLRFSFDPASSDLLRILWKGVAETTADQLVTPPPTTPDSDPAAVRDAVDVLRELLKDGPVAAETATKEQRTAGISAYAWKEARRRLHVRAVKESFSGGWRLQLPP
jgi:hypothetical protein